jgi:hypothetical protein
MPVIVPGGTVIVPKEESVPAPAATSIWAAEYEVDFTAQGVQDFTNANPATATIGSATWTAVNRLTASGPTGDVDVFDFDGSTGLRINAKGSAGTGNNNGHWYAGNQSQPYFWATLDDMITGTALAEDDTLCLQLDMTTSADCSANYMRYGLGLWKNDAPGGANNFVVVSRFFDGAVYSASIRNNQQDNLTVGGGNPQPDFFEIVSYPNGAQVISAGVIGGGAFPDPLTTTAYKAYNAMNQLGPGDSGGSLGSPAWNIPYDKAAFVISCQVQGAASSLNSTAKKMRVLRRNRS